MVSREFRTPLTTIQMSSDLLKLYAQRMNEETRQIHLEKIHFQIRQLTRMLDDVLLISRADTVGLTLHPIWMDIEDFCHDVIAGVREIAPHHQIVLTNNAAGERGVFDERLLREALHNLLSNAIKYSAEGSTVIVSLSCAEDVVTIELQDEGIGIPRLDQARLFEAFHRARNVGTRQGSGLGLAIVKRALDAHRGTIDVVSEEGAGTRFTLRLPRLYLQPVSEDDDLT